MKTFCFKLYRAKRNKKLHKTINTSALIYNHCIALHKRYYRLFNKSLNANKLKKHLTKLKRSQRFSYMTEVRSQAIQDIVERIDRAYKLFFRNLKSNIRTAPPSFKKVRKYKSFTLKQTSWRFLDGNVIEIDKYKYRYFKSCDIEGKVKTVTVKRDALGDIYIFLVCDVNEGTTASKVRTTTNQENLVRTGKIVGYDFGLKKFLTASDYNDIEAPLFLEKGMKAIKKANKMLSKKKKCSNNHKRARLVLARLHKKVANQRKDFHFKQARKICQTYTLVCIEDLNLKGMQKRWGRKISDYAFADFVKILEYQATKTGTTIQKIDRFYPSSQLCHICGTKNSQIRNLSIREWVCSNCKTKHDRDRNASINILKVGASTFFGEAS